MDEKEILIAEITNKATKEAKKQKLNETQAKLYIETEVQKALEEFKAKQAESKTTPDIAVETKKISEAKIEKRYIVHTPVLNWVGEIAGVQFAYGKAEVQEGWILNWFKERGYTVEEVSE